MESRVVSDRCLPYGIRNANGEVLIHIGVDTVELNGKGFESMVKQGDYVHQGDIPCKVDLELLKNKTLIRQSRLFLPTVKLARHPKH